MKTLSAWMLASVLSASIVVPEARAQVLIGADSVVDWGDASVSMGCTDLVVNGTANMSAARLSEVDSVNISGVLNNGSGQLSVAGNLATTGTLQGGAGTVSIVDGCARTTSQITGSPSFHNLSISTTTGKQVVFEAGKTTTVGGQLALQGASGNLLKIRSSVAGTPALLSATDQQVVQFVDVGDNRAVGSVIAPGEPTLFQSSSAGNIFRWFLFNEDGVIPKEPEPQIAAVPTLGDWALYVLSLLIALLGYRNVSRRAQLERP